MASIESRDGKYMLRWRVLGKQRTKTFGSYEEARLHKVAVESDLVSGRAVDPKASRATFKEWAESWSANRQGYRESTRTRNQTILNHHLIPAFGSARLGNITQPQVQDYFTGLVTKTGWTGKPLSPGTIKVIYQELDKCLSAAVLAKQLRDNPCVGISLPRIEQQEMHFLNQQQVRALAEGILPRYRALIYTLAYTGIRIGEASALTTASIDLENGTLRVTETASEVGSKIVTNPPKTRAGRRTIPLPQFVVDELLTHMQTYPARYVFTGRQGGQIRANAFRQRAFKNGKAAAGLHPGVRIHDLRHSAISFWIANGVDMLRVKKWAGHEKVTTIIDIYGHLYEDDDRAILGSLNKSITSGANGATKKTKKNKKTKKIKKDARSNPAVMPS